MKIGAISSFGSGDLLGDDNSCFALTADPSIDVGRSRTFDETIGANYYVYLGIGTMDMSTLLGWSGLPVSKELATRTASRRSSDPLAQHAS